MTKDFYLPKMNCFSLTVFRAGEQGRFWYAVLGGSLEVRYHAPDTESKVSWISGVSKHKTLCSPVDSLL